MRTEMPIPIWADAGRARTAEIVNSKNPKTSQRAAWVSFIVFLFLRESFFADLGRRFCHNSSRKQSTKLSEIHLLQRSNLNGPEVGVGLSPKGWLSCKVISRPLS